MSLSITDDLMTSTVTRHRAEWRPDAAADGHGAWVCTRTPGRLLDRNAAITAMTLAEHEAAGRGGDPHAAAWRQELHLSPRDGR